MMDAKTNKKIRAYEIEQIKLDKKETKEHNDERKLYDYLRSRVGDKYFTTKIIIHFVSGFIYYILFIIWLTEFITILLMPLAILIIQNELMNEYFINRIKKEEGLK